MKNDVFCLMLSNNIGVVMYASKQKGRKKRGAESESIDDREQKAESIDDREQKEYLKNLRKYRARKKRECRELQGVAEFIESKEDIEQMKYFGERCNGGMSRILCF